MPEKVVLITGGARRIGAAIARYLHEKGMQVIIHYRTSEKEAQQLSAELNQQRPNSAAILSADLTQLEACKKLIIAAEKYWGRIDALVNNASSFYPTPIANSNENQWNELMNSNARAPLFLSVYAAEMLKKTQGCIINIADIHGYKPLKNYSIYSISKAAMIMLTQSLAKELGPDIRVNAIAPGAIAWPENNNELSAEEKQKIIAQTLLKRPGTIIDIAKATYFFIQEADYITGQILAIDGGRLLT